MKPLKVMTALGLNLLLLAGTASAEESKSEIKFEIHGIVGGSLYLQDAATGPSFGAGSLFTTKEMERDKYVLGGDIRQTRLSFAISVPEILGGATPKGVIELDLFGGSSAGGFGDVSAYPRIRMAYAEVKWGSTTVQVGQNSSLLLGGIAPATVGHVALPLTYTAGMIGFRYPGIFAYQALPFTEDTKMELSLMVARSAWQNPAAASFSTNPFMSSDEFGFGLGEASGLPQLEARLKLISNKLIDVFVAGHFNRVDRSGAGAETDGNQVDLDVIAGQTGFKLLLGPLTLLGAGYIGKNLGPELGTLWQFQGPSKGDVREWGGWGQVGFNFIPELSAWFLAGTSRLKYDHAARAELVRRTNTVGSAMLRYQASGFTVGLELTHWITRTMTDSPQGNQAMLSSMYFF